MTVHIILPAYNEEKNMGPLLEGIHANMKISGLDYKIIVVNDGSMDRTAEIVKSYSVTVPILLAEHAQNRGLAKALETGLGVALESENQEDVVITMDADNTHDPSLIQGMFQKIKAGADVVIASRYLNGSRIQGVSWIRRVLSWGASFLFRLFYPIKGVKDYTCGYRAYRAKLLKQAMEFYKHDLLNQAGFSCTVDLLLKLRPFNPVAQEVPLVLRYNQKRGRSKMRIGRTVLGLLLLIMKKARVGR
jgi:dolichol-phosphate mannosyltransferase